MAYGPLSPALDVFGGTSRSPHAFGAASESLVSLGRLLLATGFWRFARSLSHRAVVEDARSAIPCRRRESTTSGRRSGLLDHVASRSRRIKHSNSEYVDESVAANFAAGKGQSRHEARCE